MVLSSPAPTPWRLDLLADDGTTASVNVPTSTDPPVWDAAEALVTSALTGVTFRPAGRTVRGVGRPLEAHDG